MSTPENKEFRCFFADSAVFWYSYPQYLTNSNLKAYWSYHFLKELNKILQAYLNILPKKKLLFCCHRLKIQKMSHFWHLMITILRVVIFAFQVFQNSVPWGRSSLHYVLVHKLYIYMPKMTFVTYCSQLSNQYGLNPIDYWLDFSILPNSEEKIEFFFKI